MLKSQLKPQSASDRVLYLTNQIRSRDGKDCAFEFGFGEDSILTTSTPIFGEKILLIGGGTGCYLYFDDPLFTGLDFTNIDLQIDSKFFKTLAVKSIQADFITYQKFHPNQFDEIWVWHSLPQYAVNAAAAELFYLKAMLYLKPGGHMRIEGPNTIDGIQVNRDDTCANFPDFRDHIMRPANEIVKFLESVGMLRIKPIYQLLHGTFKKPEQNTDLFNSAIERKIDEILKTNPDFSFEVVHNKGTIKYNQR